MGLKKVLPLLLTIVFTNAFAVHIPPPSINQWQCIAYLQSAPHPYWADSPMRSMAYLGAQKKCRAENGNGRCIQARYRCRYYQRPSQIKRCIVSDKFDHHFAVVSESKPCVRALQKCKFFHKLNRDRNGLCHVTKAYSIT